MILHDAFFDFSADILRELVKDGYTGNELLVELRQRRQALGKSMDRLIMDAERNSVPMTKAELEKMIGL